MTASATLSSIRSSALAPVPAKARIACDVAPDVSPHDEWIWRRVRAATGDVAAELNALGLRPIEPGSVSRRLFRLAARYLELVPTLEAELIRMVREVTLLEADPGYDVSHSEPRWPFAIFVSVPPATERHTALRLLENVVHEGMHLRLTEIERSRPLVRADAPHLFSPWKSHDRHAQGVLHGLYVFACIAVLFAKQELLAGLDRNGRAYASRRISEIKTEFEVVDLNSLEQGLTDDGRRFLGSLLAPTAGESPWTLRSS